MHKLLILLPDLAYRGMTQQVYLLARGLHAAGVQVHVCGLSGGPLGNHLEASGVAWSHFRWQRWFDGQAFLHLRKFLNAYQPDTIHTWGIPPLLATLAAAPQMARRVVSSAAVPSMQVGFISRSLLRWSLGRVARVVARTAAEEAFYLHERVHKDYIERIPSGVSPETGPAMARPAAVPAGGRLVVSVGPLLAHKGFREAIWALDVLRYVHGDLHLALIGEGPDEPRLRAFARSIAVAGNVHFVGRQDNAQAWLRAADLVWVPTLTRGGTQVALEAMAAARPVVGTTVPHLVETMEDGVTGFLVPPGDPVALARRTQTLLEEDRLRRQFGTAAAARVEASFPAAHLVERFSQLYNRFSP